VFLVFGADVLAGKLVCCRHRTGRLVDV
jgi:hypothetical protein